MHMYVFCLLDVYIYTCVLIRYIYFVSVLVVVINRFLFMIRVNFIYVFYLIFSCYSYVGCFVYSIYFIDSCCYF